MITIMKIGPYNPIKNGLSKYESLKLLTLHKYDPILDSDEMKKYAEIFHKNNFKKYNCILASSMARAQGTVKFLVENNFVCKNINISEDFMLDEIRFDMGKMCDGEEYERYGSMIVRKRFVDAFISDTLRDSKRDLEARCVALQQELKNLELEHENILVISHTFFIKIFLVSLKNKDLFKKPEILKRFINPNKRIMNFCEKVEVDPE